MNVMKDEFSSTDSSEMKVGELDWSPDERRWGKRREGQEASSLGLDFELLPGESPAGAMRRVHDAVKARYEDEYVQREQRAYRLAKEERERELMSQYGRELRQGVDAGQQQAVEGLQAQFAAELARDLDAQRRDLQQRYDQELAEERERVRLDVGNQHNAAMEGMHNEQWQQERAWYLQQINDNQQLRRDRDRDMFNQHVEYQQALEGERQQWQQQRQMFERQQADMQARLQMMDVQLQQQPAGPGGPGLPPFPPPYPPAPPGGPDGPPLHGGGPQAHREEVPSLGDKASVAMPSIRDYLVYKKKVELWLVLTGYTHRLGLQRLLLKLYGRVAEYVMLTLTPPREG